MADHIHAVFFDAGTGAILSTMRGARDHLPRGPVFIETDVDQDLGDLRAWRVDLAKRALVRAPILADHADIMAERDRRIAAHFTFKGHAFDCDAASREAIAAMGSVALAAVLRGAPVKDVHWHGGADAFAWLSRANDMAVMDAPTFLKFTAALAAHRSAHVFAARRLKDMPGPISDITADHHWPIYRNPEIFGDIDT